jgi:integrase
MSVKFSTIHFPNLEIRDRSFGITRTESYSTFMRDRVPKPSRAAAPFAASTILMKACVDYLERRRQKLSSRSYEAYQYHFRTLQRFFAPGRPLASFHEGHFREYQKWRLASGVGPSLINHELNALAQLLELADLWHPISRHYERLPEKNWDPPKVMTPEEEDRFLRFAERKPEWATALNAALLTGNTTIAGLCLRTLRLENIRLEQDPPVILVPATVKNSNRVRGVPLNEAALAALGNLIAQAKGRGACEPYHYLIPFRIKTGLFDPTRPASPCFLRSAFRSIRRAAGLNWVTPATFRHQAITKLLESGAPDETVRAIAGHGTEKAMKYYSHIRMHAKKAAVDRLIPGPQKAIRARASVTPNPYPLLNDLRGTAKRLGISEDRALELVLSFQHSKLAQE